MTEQGYLEEAPAAAVSGNLASERFAERIASAQGDGVVDTERVNPEFFKSSGTSVS